MIWHRRWERVHTHTYTHTSGLFCFSLTLQWSSQMYAYKGTSTHPSQTFASTRTGWQLASRKWGSFLRNQSACTLPNIWHNSTPLTHTSQRAAFNHSLTYSHRHSWALPALPLGLLSWLKHSLPRRKWMRAPGWSCGQRDRAHKWHVTDSVPATSDMCICGRIKWKVLTVNAAQ